MKQAVWAIANVSPQVKNLEAAINSTSGIRARLSRQAAASQSATPHDTNPGTMGAPSGSPSVAANSLTEEDRAVCRSMGISPEQFLASKNGAPTVSLNATTTPTPVSIALHAGTNYWTSSSSWVSVR